MRILLLLIFFRGLWETCLCMLVFSSVWVYVHVRVCGNQRLTLVVILICSPSPSASLSQGLSPPNQLVCPRHPQSLPPRCCIPNELPHPPAIHVDHEDPNYHRHVCAASTLFMESSSLSPVINFNLLSEELTQSFSFGPMHIRPYSLESIFPHC